MLLAAVADAQPQAGGQTPAAGAAAPQAQQYSQYRRQHQHK
eukprot:gene4886-34654_t